MPLPHPLLTPDRLKSLDTSGVAGFFGGRVAVESLKTLHMFEGRRWLGWYNLPGSIEIAQFYGQLPRSRFWDGVFPGANVEPAVAFELDGKKGPPFTAVLSGRSKVETGHLAQLLLEECRDRKEQPAQKAEGKNPQTVYIVHLPEMPDNSIPIPPVRKASTFLAIIPILTSIGAAVASVRLDQDWYCFAMIVLGMLASGISCIFMGDGTLTFTHRVPENFGESGNGILEHGSETCILLGGKGAVNAVIHGKFSLRFPSQQTTARRRASLRPSSTSHKPERYHAFGLCSLLLTTQFLTQLLLVPLGSLFGQVMFLFSLSVSWAYNAYLCSVNRYGEQRRFLTNHVLGEHLKITSHVLPTRMAKTVFVLMVLAGIPGKDAADAESVRNLLGRLYMNTTPVWSSWSETLLEMVVQDTIQVGEEKVENTGTENGGTTVEKDGPTTEKEGTAVKEFTEAEKGLLKKWRRDAGHARELYKQWRSGSDHKGNGISQAA